MNCLEDTDRVQSIGSQWIHLAIPSNGTNEKFDVIVFSDVLEHLIYPEKVLTKSSESLRPGGRVLISLPNVAFLNIRIGLLKGNWNYTNEGILARSHLNFYTLSTAGQLLMSSGFKVQDMEAENPIIHSAWKSVVYSILSKAWPSLFAIGWIFQVGSAQ